MFETSRLTLVWVLPHVCHLFVLATIFSTPSLHIEYFRTLWYIWCGNVDQQADCCTRGLACCRSKVGHGWLGSTGMGIVLVVMTALLNSKQQQNSYLTIAGFPFYVTVCHVTLGARVSLQSVTDKPSSKQDGQETAFLPSCSFILQSTIVITLCTSLCM